MQVYPVYANTFDMYETATEVVITFKYIDKLQEITLSTIVMNTRVGRNFAGKLQAMFPDRTTEGTQPKRTAKTKVLVAEDNLTYRQEILDLLNKNNYEAYAAENGNEAIKLADRTHPDIILMDHIMPVLNGLDAARMIKHTTNFNDTKIYLLIGYGKVNDFENDMGKILHQVIQKPIDPIDLLKEISVKK